MIANNVFPLRKIPSLLGIVLFHCVVFSIVAWLFLPNMDIDMFENYAWGQTFEWGSFKHPPFFVWITRLWFSVWPTNNFSYYCLSFFNVGISLWGILSLAKLLFLDSIKSPVNNRQLRQFLLMVLGFSVLGLPYNIYAAVFNADSILISLWPWTAYAFFSCIKAQNAKRKWFWTVMLSIFAAASFLGKYFSAVFLLTLFIISLTESQYRRWYFTWHPYVCLLLCIVFLLPHALWEYHLGFPFKTYYSYYLNEGTEKIVKHVIMFSFTGIYFFAGSWIVWLILKALDKTSHITAKPKIINDRIFYCLCLIPIGLTVIISLFGGIKVMDRWAIPIWFTLPIFLANQFTAHLDNLRSHLNLLKYFWLGLMCLIGLGFTFTLWSSYDYLSKHHDYLEARKEMVNTIEKRFQTLFPEKKLAWVGGSEWPDHTAPFAYYLKNHPRAVPGFPDRMPALVNPYKYWFKHYGVIICGKKVSDLQDRVTNCENQTISWLQSKGFPIREEVISFHAQGWRWVHLKAPVRQVKVFWIIPKVTG